MLLITVNVSVLNLSYELTETDGRSEQSSDMLSPIETQKMTSYSE